MKIIGLSVLILLLIVAAVLYKKARLESTPTAPQEPAPVDPAPTPVEDPPKKTLLSNTELDGDL